MDIQMFLEKMNAGEVVKDGSELCEWFDRLAQEAMMVTAELNGSYHAPEKVRELFSRLTGVEVDEGFRLFPPFYADCGKNIRVGKNVFINSGCRFQDQGGVRIGDGSLIGHNAVLATLDHGIAPDDRGTLYPAPIIIGKNVWLGANVTVLKGVNIGDNAVVAAGAVITRDVPANTVAAGVPARVVKHIDDHII